MNLSILEKVKESEDRDFWIKSIAELRESFRDTGGMVFAKLTGLHLRAQRLQKVESEYKVSPLDSWETIYHDLEKILRG